MASLAIMSASVFDMCVVSVAIRIEGDEATATATCEHGSVTETADTPEDAVSALASPFSDLH